ncbi:MAG: hypothetical protein ACKVQA_11920 [Burkholderiales bacterium]
MDMEPVRLGSFLPGRTPKRFVTVEADEKPLLRIDLYSSSGETFAFEEARIWAQFVTIGWGEQVYLVDLGTRRVSAIRLGSYFGHMYQAQNDLLVASAERLFLVAPGGAAIWQSEPLGIDGVVVERIDGELVHGEGEWDPPDGWRPFSVSLRDGQLV